MKERSKKERTEIGKRKRRFLAFIIAMLIGCLPTATAFAESLNIDINDDLNKYVGKKIIDGEDTVIWTTRSGAELRVYYYTGGSDPKDDYKKGNNSVSIKVNGQGITDVSMWNVENLNLDGDLLSVTLEKVPGVYTVTFDPNGGKVDTKSALTDASGKLQSLPEPSRSDYDFDGWFDQKSGGTKVTTDTVFTSNTTIYAHWKETCTVTFDANGGKGSMADQSVNKGKDTKLNPNQFTYDGKTFKSWNTKADGSGTTYADEGMIKTEKNVELYAQWGGAEPTGTCKVTFDDNGHGTAPEPQTVNKGEKVKKPENPTAEGYDFGGWFTDDKCTKEYDFDSDVNESFTLYAKWTPKTAGKFAVRFDTQGHGEAPETQYVAEGEKAEKPKDPSADGYDFGGWYEEKECRNKYDFSKPVNEDIDLYAKWTKNDKGSGHDDDDDDDHHNNDTPINPDALVAYYIKNGAVDPKAKIGKQVQGPLADSAFSGARTGGWIKAFDFSMSYDGQNSTVLKDGYIKLYVPAAYIKPGRKFRILGIGPNGVVTYNDTDASDGTVTTPPLNLQGYAFELVYMD